MRYPSFRRVHFIGIGGIGMSGIAEVLLNMGYEVSGSDIRESDTTLRLRELGADVRIGHDPGNIEGAEVVVFSSAVRADNPEMVAALNTPGLPVIPRAEMLAELMRMKHSILVAGAHGKTTTTSMIGTLLCESGLDPTVVIGGKLNAWGTNAKMGAGQFFVAEADESDGTFLLFSPSIAVITNIDREHLDYYRDIDHIVDSFIQFANRVPFYGLTVLCCDNEWVATRVLPALKRRYVTYGFREGANYRALNLRAEGFGSVYDLEWNGRVVCSFRISVPGRHNVLNSLAAVAVGRELGLSWEEIGKGLERFTGVQRRLQIKGDVKGITVIDDYGHHPTEIEAVLETLEEYFPERRKVVVFQPHRYTRTRALADEFARVFRRCHVLFMCDIYPAGEKPIPGITGEFLAEKIKRESFGDGDRIFRFRPSLEELLQEVVDSITSGDMVITLGAGNVWKVGEELLLRLRRQEPR
ncbi:UDP-N-acetylmuramate--L-alanine ligase [Thermodesulforhabdus norvegica]|uniref:UDP-N-acetylmuramate--L-alanine ligase n=1 Tax=Thermodesulforhabdus norvegica TaxID=39841 RepID=UPI003183547E